MNAEEIIAAVRITAFLPSTDPVFTAAQIRREATDVLHTVCQRAVVIARTAGAGYWLKRHTVTTASSATRYRIPHRAIGGTLEAISIGTHPNEGTAPAHRIFGDVIVFERAPTDGQSLHFDYYVRPSLLCESQTAGRITDKDVNARTVTVNSLPTDRVLAATVLTGATFDIVKPNGWHEIAVVNRTATIASTTFTFEAGTDLTDVEVGDYVRAADQTDWPCLPDDFHRTLADATAESILISKNATDKAGVVAQKAGAAWARFQDIILPRIKNAPPRIVPTVGILRGRSRRFSRLRAFGGSP